MKPLTPLLLALLGTSVAHADPGYYVVSPYPDEGLRTIEARYWTVKRPGRGEVIWPELGLSYGLTPRWTTGLLASWIGGPFIPTHISSWNWSNDVLLTQGEWPIDVALHTQLIRNRDVGNAIEFGPALHADIGRTQLTFNVFWDRAFNTYAPRATELKIQYQLRHRVVPGLYLGLQGFGELGPWQHWLPASGQSHRAGPAVWQRIDLGDGQTLNLQAAWLEGRTLGRSGHMFTARAALSF